MSKREQNRLKLEELKQRRLSKQAPQTQGERSSSDGSIDEETVDDDLSDEADQSQILPSTGLDYDGTRGSDEYESDFVEEDDGLGVDLARAGVPLHLTGHANRKPFDNFKIVIEWMIHNKLNPAFERNDEIYHLAHVKLDDEVAGHARSTFKSSAWTPDFTNTLQSSPDIHVMEINPEQAMIVTSKCEACNRSGHPPRFRVTFTGNSYDKNTLERKSRKVAKARGGSDSDDDDDDDDESSEEAEEDQNFLVGRFCFANAEIAHTLHHWRYQLNQQMLTWLKDNGHLRADKIVERENWSRKKREKLANRIVDGMNESGEMRELYRMFKQNLEAARTAKVRTPFTFPLPPPQTVSAFPPQV